MYSSTTGQSTVHAPPVSMKTIYLGQFGSDQKTSEKEVMLIFNFKGTLLFDRSKTELWSLCSGTPHLFKLYVYIFGFFVHIACAVGDMFFVFVWGRLPFSRRLDCPQFSQK
jgi:hypothetical protein